jgi:hypothetical protein
MKRSNTAAGMERRAVKEEYPEATWRCPAENPRLDRFQ